MLKIDGPRLWASLMEMAKIGATMFQRIERDNRQQ